MRALSVATFVFLFFPPNMSFAESNSTQGFIAVGPAVTPGFEGSEDYKIAPLIAGRVQRQEYYLEIQGTRARANLLPQRFFSLNDSLAFQAGPTLGYRFGRDDVENARVDSLRDVDAAIEVGGFVALQATGVFRERDALTGRVEAVSDASNAHDGYLVTLRGSYATPVGQSWRIGFSVDSTYVSDEYADTYFSIDTDNMARSGLGVFDAGGGFKDVGLDLSLLYSVTEHWGVMSFVRASRLLGDAADSPIVDGEGSANQFFGGLAVSYLF